MAGDVAEIAGAVRLLGLDEGVLEPEEILEPGARVGHLVDEGADLVEPADQQRGEAGEGDDVADAELAIGDQIGADQQHGHHRDAGGQPVQRRRPAPTSRAPGSAP